MIRHPYYAVNLSSGLAHEILLVRTFLQQPTDKQRPKQTRISSQRAPVFVTPRRIYLRRGLTLSPNPKYRWLNSLNLSDKNIAHPATNVQPWLG